ncbi:MAG TPA: amino acid adenylation domain-containing protein, partial [Pyrinomonadaceae bacterium]|nr:amino acid adenylation domain-containing protein [Pyrinomonadaceae bacterium]
RNLAVTMEYNTDLFEAETIKQMAAHFRVLLGAIIARPHAPISALPIMSDTERVELLRNLRGAADYKPARCLHDLFEQQVQKTPDAVAVSCDGERLTYKELNARANQLARHLQTLGVGPETLAGICLERSIAMVVGLLGILKAGAAYVPLDPEYPRERIAFMLEDAAVTVLLTQERLRDSLPEHSAPVLCIDSDWPQISEQDTDPVTTAVTPQNLAYVIYTSGSTGKPKGCSVTHANVARLFAATEAEFHFDEQDVWTLFHSYAFDFSVWEIWGALLYGGKLVIVPYLVSRAPEKFYDLLCDEGVTVLNQTPSAFRQLSRIAENGRLNDKLRLVIFGGEALEVASLRDWFTRHPDHPQLVNMYGITETTVHVTLRRVVAADVGVRQGSPIGNALTDLDLYVLDDCMQLVPTGIAGEMYVGGAGLARGYLNRAELTAERFVPDPYSTEPGARLYKTGDRARYLLNGQLEFLGRNDFQVKLRGFRIELGEIEAALAQHPSVKDAVVIAREDSPGHKRLVAYVIPSGSDLDILALRGFIASRLPDYMVPALIITLDSFPLSPTGKLERKALPAPESDRPTVSADFVGPRSSLEQDLADIWIRLLGIERVGIHDNFFELGGHSLLLTRLATRIRDQFGVEVPMRILFDVPTIEGISVSITSLLMDQTDDAEIAALLGELSAEEVFAG